MDISSAENKPRILVADDEDSLRRAVVRVLKSAGFDVVDAKDGLEAVELLKKGNFDAVVTDLWMPGVSGIDVLRLVREQDLLVPVLIMSVAPNVESAVEALRYGATDFVSKPVEHEELARKVRRAVDLHRLSLAKQEAFLELGAGDPAISDRLGLEVAFERALASLWIAYQPIVAAETQTVIGYEALMRGEEPTLSSPRSILQTAERLGRLPEVGRRVRHLVPMPVAATSKDTLFFVNLHAADLLDDMLFDLDTPLSAMAHRVIFEVTERASLDEVKDPRGITARLRSMGYRIAIDDLGAGYAGLTSFALLEPEFVKLDVSLVRNIDKSAVQKKLAQKMTALCHDMGISIIAEGIETAEERDTLVSLGCRYLQGYFFARPGRAFPEVRF